MTEGHVPSVPTRTSKGIITAVEYVNFKGATMPNWGVRIRHHGEECSLRTRSTEVHRVLRSTIARVCDSWHTVTFWKDGREIVNGVNWMVAELAKPSSGFSRSAWPTESKKHHASGGVGHRGPRRRTRALSTLPRTSSLMMNSRNPGEQWLRQGVGRACGARVRFRFPILGTRVRRGDEGDPRLTRQELGCCSRIMCPERRLSQLTTQRIRWRTWTVSVWPCQRANFGERAEWDGALAGRGYDRRGPAGGRQQGERSVRASG